MTNHYSKTIGYASLEYVDQEKLLHVVRVNKEIIEEYFRAEKEDVILVAGAGAGHEAVVVHKEFCLKTFGIDLNISPNNLLIGDLNLKLQRQDLSSLAFSENTFSLVYCYHVLEHVADHMAVLTEIFRVLKPGGILFIGFPNKNRLISYIGTSQKTSIIEKIKWNINDYKYKLKGKFKNKYGAHAGFTEKEFITDASIIFDTIISVRNKYMLLKYHSFNKLIKTIIYLKLETIVFPSNYFICIK